MNQKIQHLWAYANSVFLFFILFNVFVFPEHIFVIDAGWGILTIVLSFMVLSVVAFHSSVFLHSFVLIQRAKQCNGQTVWALLLSFFSLLLLMISKVMSDEVAHEWVIGSNKIYHHGEFWILTICLFVMILFVLIPLFRRAK